MLNYEFPPVGGGTGVACDHLLRAFESSRDVEVELLTSGMGRETVTERRSPSVLIRRLPVGKRALNFWTAGELARWGLQADRWVGRMLRESPFDLCHCWGGWPAGILGHRRRRQLPYLVALRGSDVPGYSARLARLDPLFLARVSRAIWRESAGVVAVSRELRTLALRTDPDRVIEVIPNGTDTHLFSPGPSPAPFTVLFVGRLIPRKAAVDAIVAFARIAEEVPEARMLVAGDGPEEPALRARVRELKLEGAVRFLGHVPYERLPEIYRSASVFVMTSTREGMPNVVLEAMASGLPIVATETAAELIDGNGFTVPVADPPALAEAILRYARDTELREQHARRSRELAEDSSWDRVASWYLELYRRIVGPQGGEAAS